MLGRGNEGTEMGSYQSYPSGKQLKEATRTTDGGGRVCNGIDELKILDPGPREGLVCCWRLGRSSDEKNKKTSVEDPEVMTRALRYGTWHWVD